MVEFFFQVPIIICRYVCICIIRIKCKIKLMTSTEHLSCYLFWTWTFLEVVLTSRNSDSDLLRSYIDYSTVTNIIFTNCFIDTSLPYLLFSFETYSQWSRLTIIHKSKWKIHQACYTDYTDKVVEHCRWPITVSFTLLFLLNISWEWWDA